MDFLAAINRLAPQLRRVVAILNNEEISPTLRKQAMTAAFQQIGQQIYGKAYNMSAFDMEILETVGRGMDPNIAVGLARNISDSIAYGDQKIAADQLVTFGIGAADLSQRDAMRTAGQLGKYRTLQIRLRGKGDCDWCRAKAARGKIINPTDEDFQRHGKCDCFYDVQGYKSRNGELKNYRPLSS